MCFFKNINKIDKSCEEKKKAQTTNMIYLGNITKDPRNIKG